MGDLASDIQKAAQERADHGKPSDAINPLLRQITRDEAVRAARADRSFDRPNPLLAAFDKNRAAARPAEPMTAARLLQRLPKAIRVGPFDYAIQVVSPHDTESTSRFGECDLTKKIINIVGCYMMSPAQCVDTFLHETLHAIGRAAALGDEDSQERFITATATGLTQVHRDNPWLARWIAEALG